MINAKNNRRQMRATRKTMVGVVGKLWDKGPCLKEWTDGARYWVRTSDPLRVREVLYH